VKGNVFVLVNSMAFEGDGCNMCLDADARLQQISKSLRCAQVMATLLPTCINVSHICSVIMQSISGARGGTKSLCKCVHDLSLCTHV